MNLVSAVLASAWAIEEDWLPQILEIAARENKATPEALADFEAKSADRGERIEQRGRNAILNIEGPLFKRANMFTAISGATSYELTMQDLRAAADDDDFEAIVLNVDSPGGEVSGCDELAEAILRAKEKKPVYAYVSGLSASAGYWLTSAADFVMVSETAQLGSIGVMMGIRDDKKRQEAMGVKNITFISSQSPNKNIGPDTPEGTKVIQKRVDDLASVFVSAVAKNRQTSVETVLSNFGKGGILIGQDAVDAGMADEIGQFEDLIARATSKDGVRRKPKPVQEKTMTDKEKTDAADSVKVEDHTKAVADAEASGAKAAQVRIKAIMACDSATKLPKQANYFAYDTDMAAEDAIKALDAAAADIPDAPKQPEKQAGSEATTEVEPKANEKSFEERKTETGALGLGSPDASGKDPEANDDPWGEAIENHKAINS